MATQPCCQLCEKHEKQWEIAQNSLDVLRSEVGELRVRENEAIQRERRTKDEMHLLVSHAQELQRILDEVKRENPTVWASVHATNADPPKTSQEAAGNFPPTPVQAISFRPMPHVVSEKADNIVETSTIQEANEAMAPSSSNLEALKHRAVSEEGRSLEGLTADLFPESRVETSVLPVIPEVDPLPEVPLNPDLEFDVEAQSVDSEKTRSEDLEPRTQEQGNKQEKGKEKERQSDETQFTPLETVDHPLDHAMSYSDERPANSGSHGKRKRRTLVQAWSDEDDEDDEEASPRSKKKLLNTFNHPVALRVPPLQTRTHQGSSPKSPGSRLALVGMEFGGGITVSEIVNENPDTVGSKRIPSKLKGKASAELPGPAQPELRQASPASSNEAEDGSDSSDRDPTYSAEASESPEAGTHSDESPERSNSDEEDFDDMDLSDSESSPPLTRSSAKAARSGSQGPESSQRSMRSSSVSSGAHDREVVPKAVNLLRDSSDEEDSDDDHDSMGSFIVHENTSSERTVSDRVSDRVSNREEPASDSDSSDNRTLSAFKEETARKQKNMVWDYKADMLVAIQRHAKIALQAVCALYRQQTEDEQGLKSSLYNNGRGFDKKNAHSGSNFGEFLVGGDGSGEMIKSVRDFEAHFPGELRSCQAIAAHHSKQLYEIYRTNKDPFWRKPRDRAR